MGNSTLRIIVGGLVAVLAAVAAIIAIGFIDIRIEGSARGAILDGRNNLVSIGDSSPLWWAVGMILVGSALLLAVWPDARTRGAALPPLLASAVLGGFALWGHASRKPGYVSIFESGEMVSATAPPPENTWGEAIGEWVLSGSLSMACLALTGALICIAAMSFLGSRSATP